VKRIVWLASFPKSGNTWMRLLLANYFSPDQEVDFNHFDTGLIAAGRRLFDEWSAIDSSELTNDELRECRGDLFRAIASHAPAPVYFRTHDAWTVSASGQPLYPPDVTLAAVYLVRHPFDVAVSMSHYLNLPLTAVAKLMGNDTFTLQRDPVGISVQFPQPVMSWHRNVSSWIEKSGLPVVLVKYEDLRADTAAALTSVLRSIVDPVDPARVARAVSLTTFERLQEQERSRGFNERWPAAAAFFRGGRVGDGFTVLSHDQRQELIAQHGPMMRMLGYL